MIYNPTNKEIEESLKKRDLDLKIESRSNLDTNPFSKLETLKFKDVKEEYVLKCVDPLLKTEVFIHNLANNDPLTAAKLLSLDMDKKIGKYYIIMEKIEFEPLFNFNTNNSIDHYKSIATKLANFHLKYSKIRNLKHHEIPVYGFSKYEKIINELGERVKTLSEDAKHEIMLKDDLVEDFSSYIGSVKHFLEPIKNTNLTLVHGDFDTGNIIVKKSDNEVYAIDYGLSHIDVPVLDIAHLLSATEMNIGIRRDIFETYYDLTHKLFPATMSMQDVRNAGKMMHLLYFLDWYLYTIEKKLVPVNYFFEQIHNRVNLLTELLKNPHD